MSNDDKFEPYWLEEDDWLVTVCPLKDELCVQPQRVRVNGDSDGVWRMNPSPSGEQLTAIPVQPPEILYADLYRVKFDLNNLKPFACLAFPV